MLKLFIVIVLFSPSVYGQSASFKEIKLKANTKFYKTPDTTIIYPLIITKDQGINIKINNSIQEVIIDDYDTTKSLKRNLYQLTNEGLINLSYQVTFNKNGILSINIYSEGCGAHCSSITTYFNFDLRTGENITLKDILYQKKLDTFIKVVQVDKIKLLDKYKKEEEESLNKKGIDSATYSWSIEQVDSNCINTITIDQFSLTSHSLQIIDPCEFPYIIRSQEPTYELKYSYNLISDFIRPEKKLRLLR